MIINIFKFSLWALLTLSLALAFPGLQLDWMALLVAAAYARAGFAFAVFYAILISWGFSAFTPTPPWILIVPLGFGLGAFEFLRRRLNAEGVAYPLLLFVLIAADTVFRMKFLIADFLWAGVTWALGVFLLPRLKDLFLAIIVAMVTWIRRPRSVGFVPAWLSRQRRGRTGRRPFGLEKGV